VYCPPETPGAAAGGGGGGAGREDAAGAGADSRRRSSRRAAARDHRLDVLLADSTTRSGASDVERSMPCSEAMRRPAANCESARREPDEAGAGAAATGDAGAGAQAAALLGRSRAEERSRRAVFAGRRPGRIARGINDAAIV